MKKINIIFAIAVLGFIVLPLMKIIQLYFDLRVMFLKKKYNAESFNECDAAIPKAFEQF